MKVLVTGASSMIGRQTVSTLLARGDTVTTLHRTRADVGGSQVLGTVTDRDTVSRACDGQDAVIHLAAKVGVTGPWVEYEQTNVTGTRVVVGAAGMASPAAFTTWVRRGVDYASALPAK